MRRRRVATGRRCLPLQRVCSWRAISSTNRRTFSRPAKALTKLGVKLTVLDEAQMKKLGMHALLGVGQGSERDSHLVAMEWNGSRKAHAPIALVGKGVCFDSGGLSLKTGAGMMGMKGDMGGAAAVTGTMHALAARK